MAMYKDNAGVSVEVGVVQYCNMQMLLQMATNIFQSQSLFFLFCFFKGCIQHSFKEKQTPVTWNKAKPNFSTFSLKALPPPSHMPFTCFLSHDTILKDKLKH